MKLIVTSGMLYGNGKGLWGELKGGKEKNVERENSING